MPLVVATAALIEYLLAITFVAIPVNAYRYGTRAQRAAEAEVVQQGHGPDLLARHGVKFSESALDTLFPFAIALCLAVLATLIVAGSGPGRILVWIAQPVLLVAGGLTTAGQVFPVPYVRAALKRAGGQVGGIDVPALIGAAGRQFPAVLRPLVVLRFVLVTSGSVLIVVLLALPAAGPHFN